MAHVIDGKIVLDQANVLVVIRSDDGKIVGLADSVPEADAIVQERTDATGKSHEWVRYPQSVVYRPGLSDTLET
jgi:hypothetical protein